MTNHEVIRRLRAARAYAGLSQQEFGEQLGLSLETYKRVEAGTRPLKEMELREIARLTGLPMGFFTADFREFFE